MAEQHRQVLQGATGGSASRRMTAEEVHPSLSKHILVDGYDFVLDLGASTGMWLHDALSQRRFLDMFSFFSSAPLGINPSGLVDDPDFMSRLAAGAVNKPSNPDVYTVEYAQFVEAFARVLGDPALPHLFFVDGGALAVENAVKAAFDWKAQRLAGEEDLAVLHLEGAFHGRSGYTMSLTNTDPAKTALFPKFHWPRIPAPAARFPLAGHEAANAAAERRSLDAAKAAFERAEGRIACFIAEPIQGEGGDNHLRPEFLLAMQALCHEHDALFVLDEVQTGGGITGTPWTYQQLGLEPDLVAFGKKTQVCGVMGGRRIDEVPGNVFRVSSRISSTWGGNLADMIRATRIFEVIERDQVFAAAARRGAYLLAGLEDLARAHPDLLDNPRGRGLMCAVDLPSRAVRDDVVRRMYADECVLVLPCGDRGLRFRPPMTITEAHIDLALAALDTCLNKTAMAAVS